MMARQQHFGLLVLVALALLAAAATAFLAPAAPQRRLLQPLSRGPVSTSAAATLLSRCRTQQPLLLAAEGEGGPGPAPAPEPKAEEAAIGPQGPPGAAAEAPAAAAAAPGSKPLQPPEDLSILPAEEREFWEKKIKADALRAKEVFVTTETGNFECQVCGWTYQEEKGFGPFKPGTQFAVLPVDFKCPNCKAGKSAFKPVTKIIAGFSDNTKYGFGGNSMTSDQKGGIIFGGLFLFFALFLSGYLLE